MSYNKKRSKCDLKYCFIVKTMLEHLSQQAVHKWQVLHLPSDRSLISAVSPEQVTKKCPTSTQHTNSFVFRDGNLHVNNVCPLLTFKKPPTFHPLSPASHPTSQKGPVLQPPACHESARAPQSSPFRHGNGGREPELFKTLSQSFLRGHPWGNPNGMRQLHYQWIWKEISLRNFSTLVNVREFALDDLHMTVTPYNGKPFLAWFKVDALR